MSTSSTHIKWTAKEDRLLVELSAQFGNDYDEIVKSFPDRTSGAIRKRIYDLKRMKKYEINTSFETELPNEMAKSELSQKEITKILNSSYKPRDLAIRLMKYDPHIVFHTMASVINSSPTCCLHIVSIIENLFTLPFVNRKAFLDEFILFFNANRCDLFLQFIYMYRILDYEHLETMFPYLHEIPSFKRVPLIAETLTVDQKMSLARAARASAQFKKNMNLKIAQLSATNAKMHNIIDDLREELMNFQQEMVHLKKRTLEMITNIRDNNRSNEQKPGVVQLEVSQMNQYPMLKEMVNKLKTGKASEEFMKFCFILHTLNITTYRKLHLMLPTYSATSIFEYTKSIRTNLAHMIQDKYFVIALLRISFHGLISFDEQNIPSTPILITLCGDGASLKPTFESTQLALYTFEVLPLNHDLPPTVVHMMPSRNGSSPKEVVQTFNDLAKYLTKLNYIVKFRATDGDISFDRIHRAFFTKYSHLLDGDFYDIILQMKDEIEIPISDLLHLLKCARSRIINHLLMIDPEGFRCVNMKLFSEAVDLGPVFADKSQAAAMKDAYALSMFSWHTFTRLIDKGRYDAAFYVLPYVYMIEAVRSPTLSKTSRIAFLNYAFILFRHHFHIVENHNPDDMFLPHYRSSCLGVLFADTIFLQRAMNTCIGIAIAIKLDKDRLALARIGTHDIELFYGHMRIVSHFNHTFENAIRTAVNAILLRKYSFDIGYPFQVNKRDNVAGIVLTKYINNQMIIDYSGVEVQSVLIQLMRGIQVPLEILNRIVEYLNNYTISIHNARSYKPIIVPHIMSGRLPSYRINAIQYTMSLLPIPNESTTFDYYMNDKVLQKKLQKVSIYQWCMRLLANIKGISYGENGFQKFDFPFEVNINSDKDLQEVKEYVEDPLSYNKEFNNKYCQDIHENNKLALNLKALKVNEDNNVKQEKNEQIIQTGGDHEDFQENEDENTRDDDNIDNELEHEILEDASANLNNEIIRNIHNISSTVYQDIEIEKHDIESEEKDKKLTSISQEDTNANDQTKLIKNLTTHNLNAWLEKHDIPKSKAMEILLQIGEKSLIYEISRALNVFSRIMLNMEDDTFHSQFGPGLRPCMKHPHLNTCKKMIETEGFSNPEEEDRFNQINDYDFAASYE